MAGLVMDNLGGRRLTALSVALLLVLLACFLLGGLLVPWRRGSQAVLATVCVDRPREPPRSLQVWPVTGGRGGCPRVESTSSLLDSGTSLDQMVIAFQLPLRRGGAQLTFSRWQQNLLGALYLDIATSKDYGLAPNATLSLDVRLSYKNKDDASSDWTLLAASEEERRLNCQLDAEYENRYNCAPMPLFNLGSLHHNYYLLNLRLPADQRNNRNAIIGGLTDAYLLTMFQNGGFTKLWVSLKTVFFPLVVALLAWFWRRVRTLQRVPTLIQGALAVVGLCTSLLNLPVEYLTLRFDLPWLSVYTITCQWIFYAALLSFWLVIAGEYQVDCDDRGSSRLAAAYWKHLTAVVSCCLTLLAVDIYKHSMKLTSPFRSIWNTRAGADLALGILIASCALAVLYVFSLGWVVWRALRSINRKCQSLLARSSAHQPFSAETLHRRKLLMFFTVTCALMTAVNFILKQMTDDLWRWDKYMSLNNSAILTGVYGMWNLYTTVMLCLLAPSRKPQPVEVEGDVDDQRNSPLDQILHRVG